MLPNLKGLLLVLFTMLVNVHAITYRGADFSSLAILERSGRTYSDGSVKPLETILASHGTNLARIRLWVSNSSEYNTAYALALARRSKAAGMTIMLDLHYSDTWADPGKQGIPSGWGTSLASLNTQIYTYTLSVMQTFVNAGVAVNFIQIGNEVNDGLLWPTAQISKAGYSPMSQVLHSAVTAVRSVSPSTRTVIHLANGWNSAAVASFYKQVFIPGQLAPEDVDIMGFSMYPFYDSGAKLSSLTTSLRNIVSLYGKDVMVVETDWPVSCPGTTLTETGIPVSDAGQVIWVNNIKNALTGLSGGHGIGVIYWEPAWMGNAGLGSSCADNLLVSGSGAARSSMSMFSS